TPAPRTGAYGSRRTSVGAWPDARPRLRTDPRGRMTRPDIATDPAVRSGKIVSTALTFDDVLLMPAHSSVLPREVELGPRFSRNVTVTLPLVSAAMDTVTETQMAIAMARQGGIGVIHKRMSVEQ